MHTSQNTSWNPYSQSTVVSAMIKTLTDKEAFERTLVQQGGNSSALLEFKINAVGLEIWISS